MADSRVPVAAVLNEMTKEEEKLEGFLSMFQLLKSELY
jgi:hypothetical protein